MKPGSSCTTAACRASAWLIASLMVLLASSGARLRRRQHVVGAGPRLVVLRGVDVEPAVHRRVAEAAQLGAADLVLAGLGDLEPGRDVVPRHRVLLEAQV